MPLVSFDWPFRLLLFRLWVILPSILNSPEYEVYPTDRLTKLLTSLSISLIDISISLVL